MTHPALEAAAKDCKTLARASASVGGPDPVDAIKHMDCDPEAINQLAEQMDPGLTKLRQKIADAEAELTKLTDSGDSGDAHKKKVAKAKHLIEKLSKKHEDLRQTQDAIYVIAYQLDKRAAKYGEWITGIADHNHTNALIVLGDFTGVGSDLTGATEAVLKAVDSIIKLARDFQEEVNELRQRAAELAARIHQN
ncbi:hypothetical protein EV193_102304 [Herbihabitans rhizosphaerae]|uniref:Uncharacterized protein n=1 Tax=Herbihabitans rhizosphaerae TaxID=1872711 RepID=A0A4Q7L2A4_9PSEU|nr:hypothetical protein [Herbihabitans rhizosphaerae]RZS43325.1 hypothetical protein EV193_102304 [Herbihabitans rhizosphaerae]